ncbi:MAG: methyltransferase domain-containing protein, partial [Streptosporangiales bacterium]|nr:methyltransferase domain-containing protein [Streptosporangiales bacterium]
EKGLNEHELGDIVQFGVRHPAVRSVSFQPVTHSGRHIEFDPLTRLTNSDIIHALAAQAPEWLRASDFFPVPCCFPACRSITYVLVDKDGVVPIPRLVKVEDHRDYVSDRVVPDYAIREALEKLWSASAFMGRPETDEQLECVTCGIDLPAAVKNVTDKASMIVIQDFQDPYTLNVRQLMKCCVEEITPDGRLIPFCAYNSVGYREEVFTGVDLSADNVATAEGVAAGARLAGQVTFHVGDAETLPFGDATFDAVIYECAFCTFTNKPVAAAGFARVLRHGGRAGITDITVNGPLPPELDDLAGWVACLADARPAEEYTQILADAGLTTTTIEQHDEALTEMIEQIQARLRLLRMAGNTIIDVGRGLDLARAAAKAAADGIAGYCLLIATRTT